MVTENLPQFVRCRRLDCDERLEPNVAGEGWTRLIAANGTAADFCSYMCLDWFLRYAPEADRAAFFAGRTHPPTQHRIMQLQQAHWADMTATEAAAAVAAGEA